MSTIAPIVHPDSIPVYLRSVDTCQIYDGTDENGIVGTVAPGTFASPVLDIHFDGEHAVK